MASRTFAGSLFLATTLFALTGCGDNTLTGTGVSKLAQSETCFSNNCHLNAISPGTGKNIPDEWKLSAHNTANGASCADCHEPEPGHPDSCNRCHGGTPSGTPGSANHVSINPEAAGKCDKCHGINLVNPNFHITTYDGITRDTLYNHYSTPGASGRVIYVAHNYVNNCRRCHNPHDTTSAKTILQQWARSLMGTDSNNHTTGTTLPLRSNYNVGTYGCPRCHTSTGAINFMTSGFSDIRAYTSKNREPMVNCDVCHSDGRANDMSAYSGKVRVVPAAAIYSPYSSHPRGIQLVRYPYLAQYDDAGPSNICVPCHTPRGGAGDIINGLERLGLFNYTGSKFPSLVDTHNSAGAGSMLGRAAFLFYTSAGKYVRIPTHRTGNSTFVIGGTMGPCIGCHMSNDRPHYFMPVTYVSNNKSNLITAVRSDAQVCSKCHDGSSAGGAQRTPAYMNTQRGRYRAAQAALAKLLVTSSNWKTFGNYTVPGTGYMRAAAYTMGASYNSGFFDSGTDGAAYVHNPTYTKQVIYDSIEWLVYNKNNLGTANFRFVPGVSQAAIVTMVKLTPTYTVSSIVYTADDALSYFCKGYVSGVSTTCDRY